MVEPLGKYKLRRRKNNMGLVLATCAISWLESSQRGVALDAVVVAEVLFHGAVDLGDGDFGVARVLVGQISPSRCKAFAVSAPGREELDKGVLLRGKVRQQQQQARGVDRSCVDPIYA